MWVPYRACQSGDKHGNMSPFRQFGNQWGLWRPGETETLCLRSAATLLCSQSWHSGKLPGAPARSSSGPLHAPRPIWDGLWPLPSYACPTLWQCRITSVPWEKPGLAPGSYSNLLCPIPTPGQDRNLYSTKEMITLLRIVAAASPNLAPHLNMAVTC